MHPQKFIQKTNLPRKIIISVKEIEEIEKKYEKDLDLELSEDDDLLIKDLQIYKVYPDIDTFKMIMWSLLELNFKAENKMKKRHEIRMIAFHLNEDRVTGFFICGE